MSKTREVCLMGGLGNQLFQFAFGRVITNFGHDNLVLDTSHDSLRRGIHGLPEIAEIIGSMNVTFLNSTFNPLSEKLRNYSIRVSSRGLSGKNLCSNISKKALEVSINGVLTKGIRRKRVVLADGLEDLSKFETHSPECMYIIGYFQTEKYFSKICIEDPVTIRILREFALDSSSRWRHLMPSTSAILHLRRGDYRNSSFGVLSSDYYRSALEAISKVTKVQKIYAVSDENDSLLIQDLGKINSNIEFIKTHDLTSSEVLGLLAQFKIIVGANSSLSWWSAAIGGLIQKNIVAFPKQWFRSGHFGTSLMLPNWIQVGGEVGLWSDM